MSFILSSAVFVSSVNFFSVCAALVHSKTSFIHFLSMLSRDAHATDIRGIASLLLTVFPMIFLIFNLTA